MRTESAAPPLVFQFVGTAQVSAPEHDDARDHAENKRGSRVHSGTSAPDSTAEPPVSIPAHERADGDSPGRRGQEVWQAPLPSAERPVTGRQASLRVSNAALDQSHRDHTTTRIPSEEPGDDSRDDDGSGPHAKTRHSFTGQAENKGVSLDVKADGPRLILPFRRPSSGLTGLAGADWLRDVSTLTPRRRRAFPYRLPLLGDIS
jgi:hypothetical protein